MRDCIYVRQSIQVWLCKHKLRIGERQVGWAAIIDVQKDVIEHCWVVSEFTKEIDTTLSQWCIGFIGNHEDKGRIRRTRERRGVGAGAGHTSWSRARAAPPAAGASWHPRWWRAPRGWGATGPACRPWRAAASRVRCAGPPRCGAVPAARRFARHSVRRFI